MFNSNGKEEVFTLEVKKSVESELLKAPIVKISIITGPSNPYTITTIILYVLPIKSQRESSNSSTVCLEV